VDESITTSQSSRILSVVGVSHVSYCTEVMLRRSIDGWRFGWVVYHKEANATKRREAALLNQVTIHKRRVPCFWGSMLPPDAFPGLHQRLYSNTNGSELSTLAIFFFLLQPLGLNSTTKTTSTLIVLLSVLVAHLTA
jgi:hypothetical protein